MPKPHLYKDSKGTSWEREREREREREIRKLTIYIYMLGSLVINYVLPERIQMNVNSI